MTHLNKGKQTNSFVPKLSKRARKCLTHVREHVWGINVAVSVSGNINKRGATCQAAQREVDIWPDGVWGPIAPFNADLDCLCMCVFETMHAMRFVYWKTKEIVPLNQNIFSTLQRAEREWGYDRFSLHHCLMLIRPVDRVNFNLSVTKSCDLKVHSTFSHQRTALFLREFNLNVCD